MDNRRRNNRSYFITDLQKRRFLFEMGTDTLDRKQLNAIGLSIGITTIQTKKHLDRLFEQKKIKKSVNLMDTRRVYYVRR